MNWTPTNNTRPETGEIRGQFRTLAVPAFNPPAAGAAAKPALESRGMFRAFAPAAPANAAAVEPASARPAVESRGMFRAFTPAPGPAPVATEPVKAKSPLESRGIFRSFHAMLTPGMAGAK